MRSDRGTNLATVLLLICCIGGSVSVGSMATHRVLIRTVVQHGNASYVEKVARTHELELSIVWIPQIVDGDLLPLADIEERHNLPPPSRG